MRFGWDETRPLVAEAQRIVRLEVIGGWRKERRGVKVELNEEEVLEMGHDDREIVVEVGAGIGLDKNAMMKLIGRN